MRRVLFALTLVLAALLACKSKHRVNGDITLNGAPFEGTTCNVSLVTMDMGGGSATTRSVTLTDATGRRLSFGDSQGVSVLVGIGTGPPIDAGRGCGTARFMGSTTDPRNLRVLLDVNCRGSGYETRAKAELIGCGVMGLGAP